MALTIASFDFDPALVLVPLSVKIHEWSLKFTHSSKEIINFSCNGKFLVSNYSWKGRILCTFKRQVLLTKLLKSLVAIHDIKGVPVTRSIPVWPPVYSASCRYKSPPLNFYSAPPLLTTEQCSFLFLLGINHFGLLSPGSNVQGKQWQDRSAVALQTFLPCL